MATLTVTAKGQITLKQELLRHLNVAPGQKVKAEKLPDGRLMVTAAAKTGSIDRFSGSLGGRVRPSSPSPKSRRLQKMLGLASDEGLCRHERPGSGGGTRQRATGHARRQHTSE